MSSILLRIRKVHVVVGQSVFKKCTSMRVPSRILVNQLFCDDLDAVLAVLTDLIWKGYIKDWVN